jgi:hypothetical protein
VQREGAKSSSDADKSGSDENDDGPDGGEMMPIPDMDLDIKQIILPEGNKYLENYKWDNRFLQSCGI